jgi:ABC-2 type transport system permease protein
MLAILSKELRSYFYSATAYIFMGMFLLLAGIFFALSNILSQPNAYFNSVLGSLTLVFVLISPMLTMKIMADETKTRTDQLLLTSPQTITTIVLGKYLAAVTLFLITLLITVLFPLMLSLFGEVAVLEILTSYIGFFLMGSSVIAIGVFISSLTDNVVAAAVGTFGANLIIWLLNSIKQGVPGGSTAGLIFTIILVFAVFAIVYYSTKNLVVSAATFVIGIAAVVSIFIMKKTLFEGFIANVLGWFSLLERNSMFGMGVLNLNSIVYFISFSFVFVFLTIRMVEKRRWS